MRICATSSWLHDVARRIWIISSRTRPMLRRSMCSSVSTNTTWFATSWNPPRRSSLSA
ncbi:hypothetical protein PPTG_15831 [Phytophthora nicotianae INRA-310]|uniref:Uncharacterized protein n=1 Tax=Phytophthora nicotianae (strain INRA-310) TaxID=761204 RepID=W2PQH1_PHYN3|nr:hypothetical protein PPTG_15831 [Phytophthora nicotianae INRA-310]ETN02876.1 hypothetical protein PPTG_15831 [Phytophthora nicotianae INRA-310]